MIRISTVIVLLLVGQSASAKDVALILTDTQRLSLTQILDLATKAYGLQIAPATVQLKALLDAAPEVTARTAPGPDDKPAESKEEAK